VFALVPSFWQRPYRAWPRLWHRASLRLPTAAFAIGLACAASGCSFSYQLDSLFGKSEDKAAEAGAVKPAAANSGLDLADGDLAIARAAASEVMARGGKDASLPWENPQTGARGTVTAIAAAYNQDGFVCRDFLASYVKNSTESWMRGEACRLHKGRWEVRNLKPWQRT
jgi:surface antigen